MGVVETTMVTRERRPPKDLFRRAGQAPKDGYFVGGSSSWSGWSTWAWPGSCGCCPSRPAVSARTGSSSSSSTPRRTRWPGPPPPARRPAYPSRHRARPATEASRRATAGPGLEERPPRPHPAQPAAQPRRPDDPGATRHAEWQLGLLAQILQEGKTVSVRAVDDLAGAVAADRGRDAYALPGDVLRGMLASQIDDLLGVCVGHHGQR